LHNKSRCNFILFIRFRKKYNNRESGSAPLKFPSFVGEDPSRSLRRSVSVSLAATYLPVAALISTCRILPSTEDVLQIIIDQEKRTYTHSQCAMCHHCHVVITIAQIVDCALDRPESELQADARFQKRGMKRSRKLLGLRVPSRWYERRILENRARIAREWRRPIVQFFVS